jgi:hypothetical protein
MLMRKEPSALYQLIEDRLSEPLAEFVVARRPLVQATPWRDIATEIKERTGVTVTGEGLRQWFANRDSKPAAPAPAGGVA